jgi:hypothetical protein
MWKRIVQLLLLTLFAASLSLTCGAQNQTKETVVVLVHANLIDGISPEVLPDATVVVRGSRIESVGRNAVAPLAGAEVVDVKGRWLLPGFVDAHAHLFSLASARRALQYGSTTVRVLGVEHFVDVGMRELNNTGWTDIPAVVAAGYQIRPDLGAVFPGFLLDFPNLNRLMGFLLYTQQDARTKADLWVLPLTASGTPSGTPAPFANTEFSESAGQFSPDTHWIAYASDESGRSEIYVQPFPTPPEGGSKTSVSRDGGNQPRWRRDGKELFYLSSTES